MVRIMNCKLICNKGWWYVELPFNAGRIDLGDTIQDAIDMSDDLKIINHIENGIITPEEIENEGDVYLPKEEIEKKMRTLKVVER